MNREPSRTFVRLGQTLAITQACLALTAVMSAQTGVPKPSEVARDDDDTVRLTPFQVQADSDKSYGALNSNSITAFNVSLDRVPVTADILTEAFMKEMGGMTVEGMLTAYDAGANYGGSGPAQAVINQPGDHGSNPGVSLRGSKKGLAPQTDGIQLNAGNYGSTNFGSSNAFDLERIEVLNGPQALLYQGAGAGGVINQIQKQARFGRPTFGEFGFRVDQYGTKYATFDYGMSKGRYALRIAAVDGSIQSRRVNLDERLKGLYLQFAARVANTTLTLSLRQSVSTKTYQNYATITSTGDTTFSKFNGYDLRYLLATNQADAVLNGKVTWDNAGSYGGYQLTDFAVAESGVVKAESNWSRNFSTQLVFGGANFNVLQAGYNATLNMYSPGATSNPQPGNWTMGFPASGNPMQAAWRPHISKAIRFVALYSHDIFNGRGKSKTSLDIDSTSTLASLPTQNYFKTDDDWNIIIDPKVTTKNGRTQVPAMSWTVNDGPVLYSLVNPGVDRFIWNGVKYRMQANNIGPQGRTYYFQKGFALVNYTDWYNGKVQTMLGGRYNSTNGIDDNIPFRKPEYSFGVVYHPLTWLAPYYQLSDLWMTGNDQQPDGTYGPSNHNVNQELGVKLTPSDGRISGSISFYRKADTSESFNAPGIASIVSPDGLNGNLPDGTGGNMAANAVTYGLTAALTASPTKNWRMRLSAAWTGGEFKQRVTYSQYYNDQFNTNSSGQVTYADKTVVYVPAAFNAKQLTVAAGTPGATPLTVAMLSTPGNPYYAQPQPLTGAILKTSPGGLVLLSTDATHGAIVTGATGLPISSYQLDTKLSGVSPVGTVYGALPGGQTFGYPAISANFTSMYDFTQGWLRGFKLGGTVTGQWKYLVNYYYPGLTQAVPSQMQEFSYPTQVKFDLIAGYTHRFKRVTFSSQVNANNLFNNYRVLLFPNINSGFTVPTAIKANFYGQPRLWSWTNRISF